MKGYLLDTNVALIAGGDPDKLSTAVRQALLTGPNVLSVVSYWEVAIKTMKGTLRVGDPNTWWRDSLDQLAATPLPLREDHVAELYSLPSVHKDPFDRILIAQATAESLALTTTDTGILRYASRRLQIVC